jgi:DNA repair exonuclease SbcCD ATPase subunit
LKEDRENFQDAVRDAQRQPEIPEGVTAADGSASYAPQSATVQGILKDMYDSFSEDLESQTQAESSANRQFEALIAEKTEQVNHKNEEIMKREEEKAATEAELADKVKALDDLVATYEADKKWFDEMEPVCRAKHEEWETRSAQRKEELEGINEALKILTSDEARALFNKAIKPGMETSFLQLGSSDDESAPASKAYAVLKDQAKASHSIRLAALAARVRTTKAGHFDQVIEEIDKVIAALKEEEKEDIKQRDFCKDEYHKNDEEQADLTWKIKVNEEMIAKLEEKIAKLTENIEDTAKEIKETEIQIKDMEDERISEHDAFQEAKSDDEAAVKLLGQAIEALSKFYKKEGVDMGPIQGSSKLLQEPEFKVSQWQAPDATFSDKGKRKNQSKGVIGILTMLMEDLEDEIKNGIKDEVAAQAEFEKQVATAKALIKDLEEKKTDLENTRAQTDEQKELEHDTMKENKGTLTDKIDYRKSITEGCDWLLKAFDERVQKRKAEMEGLVKAKEYLAGAAPPAMLETSKTFDDNKLSEISFHGLSFLQRQ